MHIHKVIIKIKKKQQQQPIIFLINFSLAISAKHFQNSSRPSVKGIGKVRVPFLENLFQSCLEFFPKFDQTESNKSVTIFCAFKIFAG
jgi:hypothetical protein